MTDIFQEVEEDLRRDQLTRLWKKYGIQAIAVAVVAVLVASAFVGWKSYRTSQARAASLKYQEVTAAGDRDATPKAPEELIKSLDAAEKDLAGGYKVLARFERAAALVKSGHGDEAAKLLNAIADDKSIDVSLRDAARLKAAYLEIETKSFSDMRDKLAPLVEPESAFRFAAGELLGYSAFRAGDLAAARTYFQTIAADVAAPADIKQRTEDMLSEIAQRLPNPAAGGASGRAPGPAAQNAAPPAKQPR